MSPFEIFRAVPADALEIGNLRAHNWREQYAHLNGVTEEWMNQQIGRIAGETSTKDRAYWIRQSNRPSADNFWLVAKSVDGALAGFLEARKLVDGTQELRSLHVVPDMRGKGIGQALLDVAHDDQWFDPSIEIFLDVAEVNEAGQRFYVRAPNNYVFTGHRFFYGPIAMLRMARQH